MNMEEIAKHVSTLMNAQGYKDWFHYMSRKKCGELWGMVKPMMHQNTTNDWNDLYALVEECHKLAVEMIVSENEFSFEEVDIQTRFDPRTMLNREQTMAGMSADDLARRGAVVKLGITPAVRARGYGRAGGASEALLYPAMVLTKWADVHGHQRN